MKKLNITAGGIMPFWTKDLEFMQSGISEALAVMAKSLSFGRENFLISGCEITDTGRSISMTSGWCFYEGEIMQVEELSETMYSGASPRIKFTKTTSFDRNGDRQITLLGNLENARVYQYNSLVPSIAGSADTYTLAIGVGAWRLDERIAYQSKMQDSGLVKLDVQGYNGELQYRITGSMVQLYGEISNDALGAGIRGYISYGLPQPIRELKMYYSWGTVEIDARGGLIVTSQNDSVRLDQVIYISTPNYAANDKHYKSGMDVENGGLQS